MPVHNSQVAEIFNEIADLLEIEGENQFRIRAYRNAARTVGNLPHSVADMLEHGEELSELPGIGKDLAGKIAEIVRTGKLSTLEELKGHFPPNLVALMRLPGLGAKRIRALQQHGIDTIQKLRVAASVGRIREFAGFGAKSEKNVLDAIDRQRAASSRVKLIVAQEISDSLVPWLRKAHGVEHVIVAGSFRRRMETVGDIDILITCDSPAEVMERFISYDEVERVLARGDTRSAVLLRSGVQVDVRVVPEESFGAALLYFTGSKAHNIELRKLAMKRGLKISEYGVFRGTRSIAGRTEEEVYQQVGLPFIEPELRENRGEIEAARAHTLPKLITLKDLRGDLHCHTKDSDGRHTMEEMAEAARRRGHEYIAITDHSKRLGITHGLTATRLAEQVRRIDHLNAKLHGITLLKSVEVDILDDGSLDLPDSILSKLDFVVGSIHSKFNLSREQQTKRVLCAMENPHFNILAHPTGRLINERQPYELDLEKVMRAARGHGCTLEINAQPDRLDLSDVHCRLAKDLDVKVVISTDAHSVSDLEFIHFGVDQARRGWLEAANVINAAPFDELRRKLRRH